MEAWACRGREGSCGQRKVLALDTEGRGAPARRGPEVGRGHTSDHGEGSGRHLTWGRRSRRAEEQYPTLDCLKPHHDAEHTHLAPACANRELGNTVFQEE